MYRVLIQENLLTDNKDAGEQMPTVHEMESNDSIVVAKFLRAVADKLDPPKDTKVYR